MNLIIGNSEYNTDISEYNILNNEIEYWEK